MSAAVAAVVGASAFLALGHWRPRMPRPFQRPGLLTDVLHAIVNGTGLDFLLAFALTGLGRPGRMGAQPAWLQAVVLLFLGDLVKWTLHVLQHRVPLLWRFHRLHHSVRELDALGAAHTHPVEALVNRLVFAAFVLVLGIRPAIVAAYATLDLLQGLWVHSNTHVRLGWLNRVLATQEFHHWHHADDPAAANRNFGGFLSVWDWVFGTAYCPRDRDVAAFGLRELSPPPAGYLDQLLLPFRSGRAASAGCAPGRR